MRPGLAKIGQAAVVVADAEAAMVVVAADAGVVEEAEVAEAEVAGIRVATKERKNRFTNLKTAEP